MKQTNYLKFAICIAASVMLVGCAGTRYSRSTGEYIDDKAAATRVKSALAKDSLVKAADIQVQSFRGNVHLTGFVDHPAQKERASQLTRNTKGVSWFKNDIVVKESLPTESGMAGGQQMNEPAGASRDYNQQQSFRHQSSTAGSSASSAEGWQKGAIQVYDPAANISVQPTPTVRGSSGNISPTRQERGASALVSNQSTADNDLTQRVYTELHSDKSSAAQNVRIESSANGKVILRGTVGSKDEKESIENKVKAIPGVRNVDNKLEVENQ
jgi:osmotically-inducible protein OsmY